MYAKRMMMVLAAVAGLGAFATEKPILETSEKAFAPTLACDGKVGAGKSYPEITKALDASPAFTVSMWVKVNRFPTADDTGAQSMLGLFSRGWGLRWTLSKVLGVQLTYPGKDGKKDQYGYYQWVLPPQGLVEGDWNHFAFVYSPTGATMYVNGEVKSRGCPGKNRTPGWKGEAFRLGSLPSYAPMNGEIGRTRVWDRAVGPDELFACERDAVCELSARYGAKADDLPSLVKARNQYRLDAADRALAGGKTLYWGVLDPLGPEYYLYDSKLKPETINKPLLVCSAKGEYEAASFMVRSLEDVEDFLPIVSDLVLVGRQPTTNNQQPATKLPASIVDVRFVKNAVVRGGNRFIRVRRGEYLLHDDAMLKCDFENMQSYIRCNTPTGDVYRCVTEPGDSRNFETYMSAAKWNIHDAATIQPLTLVKREGLQYWLTFHVPETAEAGLYTGSVALTAKGRTLATVPVKLRVLPFALPEPRTGWDVTKKFRPSVYYRHNWHNLTDPKAVGSITSRGRNERQFRAELRSLKAHNILYPTVVMAFAFPGWSWDDYWGNDPKNGTGKERVVTQEQKDYFKRCLAILKEEGFPMDQLFFHTGGNFGFRNGYDPARSRDVLKRSVEETLAMVDEVVGTKDVDVQFYGVDEAYGQQLLNEFAIWDDIHRFGGRVFTTALRSHAPDVVGHLETQIASGAPSRKYARMHHEKGSAIWNYANPQAGTKYTAHPYRVNFGFGCYSEEYDGFATYGWNVSAENPWNDFDNKVEPDLAFVVGTADGVIDTPSHEGYREAVDDIRYATKLRLLCREKPGALADEATAFLNAIDVYARGFDATYTRLRIIDYILKLLK